jgi:hypothetical protein
MHANSRGIGELAQANSHDRTHEMLQEHVQYINTVNAVIWSPDNAVPQSVP